MANQYAIQDQNHAPALLGHSGTSDSSETRRIAVGVQGNIVTTMKDNYGFSVENTPMDEMRTVIPFRLVGAIFSGTVLDTSFWTYAGSAGGTAQASGGQLSLKTGTVADSDQSVQSVRTARYVSASANRWRGIMRLPDSGVAGNIRRWGAFGTGSGAFFEMDGTTLGVVTRINGTDTRVASGNFNGFSGSTYTPGTLVNTYEIYWTNSNAWFTVGGTLLHTTRGSTAPWSDSVTLPIRVENNNGTGNSEDLTLEARVMSISRLGAEQTGATSKYQAGAGTVICKYGAGNLHGVVISGVANTSVVTLYDNIGTSATSILWSSGAMGAQTTPFGLDLHNIPFFTGLTLEIKAANSNTMVAYE